MKALLSIAALLCAGHIVAQNTDIIIKTPDSLDFALFIDGKEYKTDRADLIKITDIPEAALLNVNGVLTGNRPMTFFERVECTGSKEWYFEVVITAKGDNLILELVAERAKDKDFKQMDMGADYIVYRFGKYATPQERAKSTVDASSSVKSKRTKEETPTMVMEDEDGNLVEKKEERRQTVSESGSSTVIKSERTTTSTGDEREHTILKPRAETCGSAWEASVRESQMGRLYEENDDPGRLYMGKVLAIENCMTAEDAGLIVSQLGTESMRMEMAKFIYPSIVDPDNFELLEQYFDTKSAWEAIELYIDVKYK
ncbi:MAG: DUF4476 domain-containing protein [Bacteroidetes bacterium]|nr:DUF4476 domain-containing protein [Bacteroidota bacterium]